MRSLVHTQVVSVMKTGFLLQNYRRVLITFTFHTFSKVTMKNPFILFRHLETVPGLR